MRHPIPWIVAGTLVAAAPTALAQALDRANLHEVDDDAAVTYEGRSIEQIEDMDVVRDGESIGEIEEVLADADGKIVAVVVEYDDGFLDLMRPRRFSRSTRSGSTQPALPSLSTTPSSRRFRSGTTERRTADPRARLPTRISFRPAGFPAAAQAASATTGALATAPSRVTSLRFWAVPQR
jgi:hypothetical protein